MPVISIFSVHENWAVGIYKLYEWKRMNASNLSVTKKGICATNTENNFRCNGNNNLWNYHGFEVGRNHRLMLQGFEFPRDSLGSWSDLSSCVPWEIHQSLYRFKHETKSNPPFIVQNYYTLTSVYIFSRVTIL